MRTIRRLYFYLVALISVEVVLWGLINLLRTTLASELAFPGADTLAQALALIVVGMPIFLLHWLWAQRATRDPEEHSATLRAVFLYAVLLATLVPVTQNVLAFINRSLVQSAGIDSYRALFGGAQTWVDNLIAIGLNLIAAAYFFNVLRRDWATLSDKENFADIRRLYRYLWVLYSLLMLIFGAQQVLRFLFYIPSAILGEPGREMFVNGLALLLVGTPVWAYMWTVCQNAVHEPGEGGSTLRLVVLYLLGLAGVIVVLSSAGVLVDTLLRFALGERLDAYTLLGRIGAPISIAIPLGVVWAYYGTWLSREIAAAPQPRRSGLGRFYAYILSIIGLVATFIGLALLLSFVIEALVGMSAVWGNLLRNRLTASVATLLAGLPLWLAAWRPMQAQALAAGDEGDHARRSLVRRAYLYLAIFATVIGGMISAIAVVYIVLFGVLDHFTENFVLDVLNALQLLGLFIAFLAYHWMALRMDGGHAADALATRQGQFPVLIFEPAGSDFAARMQAALHKASPEIPVAAQSVADGIPDGAEAVRAVVLPASLASNPPEALRLWLADYSGDKLVVPVEVKGWYWIGGIPRNAFDLAAQTLRQMAEGQEVRLSSGTSAWQMVAYIFAILFGLQLLFLLLTLGISIVVG